MENILDAYKKQLEEDNKNGYSDEDVLNKIHDDKMKERMRNELKKLRSGEISEQEKKIGEMNTKRNMEELGRFIDYEDEDEENVEKTDENHYIESQLEKENLVKSEDVKIVIKRAYCKVCGKELSTGVRPKRYNAMTFKPLYECNCCGITYSLNNPYPRIAITDKEGNEYPINLK